MKGDLQMHTVWSAGTAPIAEMAAAAVELDYEYIAFTDNAKGLKIAGGMDEAKLRAQVAEIDSVNESLQTAGRKLKVFHYREGARRRLAADQVSTASTWPTVSNRSCL